MASARQNLLGVLHRLRRRSLTVYALALGGIWALAAVLALVLVLQHLKSLHLTKTQADALHGELAGLDARIGNVVKARDDTNAKLTAIGNRVR